MVISVKKSLLITLLGILGMGFLPIAEAKVMWVKAASFHSGHCPDVCQRTKYFHPKHPEFNLLYAIPSGIHSHDNVQNTFYVCAANHRRFGPHIGYTIGHGGYECHVADLARGKSSSHVYHCLCSDTPVEPIKAAE
jgi:hypothetical protein